MRALMVTRNPAPKKTKRTKLGKENKEFSGRRSHLYAKLLRTIDWHIYRPFSCYTWKTTLLSWNVSYEHKDTTLAHGLALAYCWMGLLQDRTLIILTGRRIYNMKLKTTSRDHSVHFLWAEAQLPHSQSKSFFLSSALFCAFVTDRNTTY